MNTELMSRFEKLPRAEQEELCRIIAAQTGLAVNVVVAHPVFSKESWQWLNDYETHVIERTC